MENSCCANKAMRLGVFGGTFNPVHNRHIEIAERVCALFSLDRVLMIVAKDPPHKQVTGANSSQRYDMVRLAANGTKCLMASDVELHRAGKSYTFDTLTELKDVYPGAELFLILGDDMLFDLTAWYRAEELMQMAVIVAIPRETELRYAREKAAQLCEQYGADIHVLDIAISPISSTMVRERVYNALPVNTLVSAQVERFIYEEGLYQPENVSIFRQVLKERLSPSRFIHTMGVVRTAVNLSQIHSIDGESARIAALLHDYGRSVDKDALSHSDTGARLARDELGITDETVLSAIRRHTTLGINSSPLDRLIYLADMIEPSREYPGVNEIRSLALRNLDKAVIMGLERTIDYVKQKDMPVAEGSLQALHEITREIAGIEYKQNNEKKGDPKLELKEQVLALCEMLYGKKAEEIVAIHVADKTIIADWFVVCSARSTTLAKAIADEVEDKAEKIGLSLRRSDGYREARWIVLDYASILVHIFIPDERKYYNMERLWMDDPGEAIMYSQEMETK